jgi:[ribosomal protein S18]-alanine N-acetyltransferase
VLASSVKNDPGTNQQSSGRLSQTTTLPAQYLRWAFGAALSTARVLPSRFCPVPPYSAPRYNGSVPFTIRDFQPADFDTLWRIDQDCFPPGISYSRTELKIYMRRRGSFTLVVVGAVAAAPGVPDSGKGEKYSLAIAPSDLAVVGFIVAEAASRSHGHIITIDVVARARRFGVGSRLLRAAEDRLRAAQCRSVELETAVDNLSALSFYKRHAYNIINTYPRYYSNGVDALVLQKDLAGQPPG